MLAKNSLLLGNPERSTLLLIAPERSKLWSARRRDSPVKAESWQLLSTRTGAPKPFSIFPYPFSFLTSTSTHAP
jgi:hypothetical protein